MIKKYVVLFVNSLHKPTLPALKAHAEKTGNALQPVVVIDKNIEHYILKLNDQDHLKSDVTVISADFNSPADLRRALKPYQNTAVALISQYENSITEYKKLIPYLPHLPAPTETSLEWSTDKKLMREAFNAYDPSLSPASMEVRNASPQTIAAIEATITYPMIIKPSGLERSLLVSVVHNSRELAATLASTFKQLDKAYKKWMKRLTPAIVVEELMEGDMYSVDTYISSDGTCRHAAPIKVVTGRKVGFEDFFSYLQMSPSGLSAEEVQQAHDTVAKACRALGLRSVTAHTELMNTPRGWKIIEVGPRIGGYRHELYTLSHGMNHIANDVLNRAGQEPEIPSAPSGYAAIFKTYGRQEGILSGIDGLETIQKLPSYVTMKTPFRRGDEVKFARNNGDAVIEITLCHGNAKQLQKDIATIESVLDIQVESAAKAAAKKRRNHMKVRVM